jgi:hypothetical protein
MMFNLHAAQANFWLRKAGELGGWAWLHNTATDGSPHVGCLAASTVLLRR